MTNKRFLFSALLLLLLHAGTSGQTALPRSAPEAEGVSSEGILRFVAAAEASSHELHSFMLLRHGKVIAEGWWAPYGPALKHTMYSCSKSFTATAIGFAVAENRLTVDDKVVSFFPDDLPALVSPNLAALRVRDLLSMSTGQEPEPTYLMGLDSNWVRAFLATPFVHEPGTQFLYNSMATYMLSAIIQKVTGEKLLDYLTPRLFEPLGIRDVDWESDPTGKTHVGGWGLRLKTEDMAKFGQLFLQKGRWNGRQILPESWIEEASTLKIVQHPAMPQADRDKSDWEQGYAYQMWRSRHNSYRGDGAYGQFVIVMPEQDAVLAITAETHDMQGEFNLVWQYLLPAFQDEVPPAGRNAVALRRKLAALALPLPAKSAASPLEKSLSGKTVNLRPNDDFLRQVNFQFDKNGCRVGLYVAGDTFRIAFGAGSWAMGQTNKYPPALTRFALGYFAGLPPSRVAGAYRWVDANTLELTLRYLESPHSEVMTFAFAGDSVSVQYRTSQRPGAVSAISGRLSQQAAAPVRLIVRGDDMGFSHAANEALIQSYREGIETTIEVLVPSPWFPEAAAMLAQNPGVDVGIHLALSSEWDNIKWRPLSDCPSLQNADGYFYPMIFANPDYPGQALAENKWTLADVEREFRAQIELGLKRLPNVSHLSAHMGCNWLSEDVNALTQRLAREYGIPIAPHDLRRHHVNYDGPHGTLAEKKRSFLAMLRKLEPGQSYIFLDHPAYDNAEMRAIYHMGYEGVAADRQGVTDLFTDPEIKAFIRKNGIALIGYKDF